MVEGLIYRLVEALLAEEKDRTPPNGIVVTGFVPLMVDVKQSQDSFSEYPIYFLLHRQPRPEPDVPSQPRLLLNLIPEERNYKHPQSVLDSSHASQPSLPWVRSPCLGPVILRIVESPEGLTTRGMNS